MESLKVVINGEEYVKASDPWPHWWLCMNGRYLVRHDSAGSGVFWCGSAEQQKLSPRHTEQWHIDSHYTRIPAPEAAALLAKWEADRTLSPALPGAEEVAVLRRKIAQMEKHLRWIAYEPIGPANNTAEAILDEITNTTRAVIFELAKPECRVKHDWTGAMGTVLMEHDGTAFVKWDDGQVTSVYNRHLQKELQ